MWIGKRPSWLDLLPSRIDQAVSTPFSRRVRNRYQRKRRRQKAEGPCEKRRLFIDLAVISKHDAGTGIQRVVRALALALIKAAPVAGWELVFVSATRRRPYREVSWPQSDPSKRSEEMSGRPGDVFLGLDYSLDTIRWHRSQLKRFRRSGGRLWFLVHDLLPLLRPDWFSRNTVLRYAAWLDILAGLSDGFVCNSQQTEEELRSALAERYGLIRGYQTAVVPMGANILEARAPAASVENGPRPARFDTSAPYLLMVGTLEPRKGHEDIVAAFDLLWKEGAEQRLVLVGRQGWQVDAFVEQIRGHVEHGRKLLWFDDVDDHELSAIYSGCTGFIMASHAEGFGLPLIEALNSYKPVLARDIAVFRAHEKHGVRYFPVDADTAALAEGIRCWISDVQAGHITVTQPEANWEASAAELLSALGVAFPAPTAAG